MPNDSANNTALAVRPANVLQVGEGRPLRYTLSELKQVGETMLASGMFKDIRSIQQAMVKLLAGAERGYGPFQSMRAYHVIEGKPTETSGEIDSRIKASREYRKDHYWINEARDRIDPVKSKISEHFGCVIIIEEKRGGKWVALEPVVFTLEDARTAGLANKPVWKNYPKAMLYARALTQAARWHCADIFGGPIYHPEELGASVTIDGEGHEIIDATVSIDNPPAETAELTEQVVTDRDRQELAIYATNRGLSKKLYRDTLRELFPSLYPEGEVPSSKKLTTKAQLDQVRLTIQERTSETQA